MEVGGPSRSWDLAGPIRVWDTDTGQLRFTFAQDWPDIRQIEISPDRRFLAATNAKGQLILWDVASGHEQLNPELDHWSGFRYSPTSEHIIFETKAEILARSNLVHFWNIQAKCEDGIVPGSIHETAIAPMGKVSRNGSGMTLGCHMLACSSGAWVSNRVKLP